MQFAFAISVILCYSTNFITTSHPYGTIRQVGQFDESINELRIVRQANGTNEEKTQKPDVGSKTEAPKPDEGSKAKNENPKEDNGAKTQKPDEGSKAKVEKPEKDNVAKTQKPDQDSIAKTEKPEEDNKANKTDGSDEREYRRPQIKRPKIYQDIPDLVEEETPIQKDMDEIKPCGGPGEYIEERMHEDEARMTGLDIKIPGSYYIVAPNAPPELVPYLMQYRRTDDDEQFEVMSEEKADPNAFDPMTAFNGHDEEVEIEGSGEEGQTEKEPEENGEKEKDKDGKAEKGKKKDGKGEKVDDKKDKGESKDKKDGEVANVVNKDGKKDKKEGEVEKVDNKLDKKEEKIENDEINNYVDKDEDNRFDLSDTDRNKETDRNEVDKKNQGDEKERNGKSSDKKLVNTEENGEYDNEDVVRSPNIGDVNKPKHRVNQTEGEIEELNANSKNQKPEKEGSKKTNIKQADDGKDKHYDESDDDDSDERTGEDREKNPMMKPKGKLDELKTDKNNQNITEGNGKENDIKQKNYEDDGKNDDNRDNKGVNQSKGNTSEEKNKKDKKQKSNDDDNDDNSDKTIKDDNDDKNSEKQPKGNTKKTSVNIQRLTKKPETVFWKRKHLFGYNE